MDAKEYTIKHGYLINNQEPEVQSTSYKIINVMTSKYNINITQAQNKSIIY